MTIFFFLTALFAEIVGTIAGFGSSTILLPLATFFFNFTTALALVAFFHLFGIKKLFLSSAFPASFLV